MDSVQDAAVANIINHAKEDKCSTEEILNRVGNQLHEEVKRMAEEQKGPIVTSAPSIPADRVLASVRKVYSCEKHTNADRLFVVKLTSLDSDEPSGWQMVVIQCYRPDEWVIFIEIDSVLPPRPEYEFMADSKWRVRTIRLRGELSQGLIFPLSLLGSWVASPKLFELVEGTDLTELMGIRKYSPLLEYGAGGEPYHNVNLFPTEFADKTEETRLQNVRLTQWVVEDKESCTATEKLHGTSATFIISGEGQITHVCSRNHTRSVPDGSVWWRVAERLQARLLDHFTELQDLRLPLPLVVQGEICGPGINGNHYGLATENLYLFTVTDGARDRVSYSNLRAVGLVLGCPVVPQIATDLNLNEMTKTELLVLAEGQSLLKPSQIREGIVVRSNDNPYRSFKVISNAFLLGGQSRRQKKTKAKTKAQTVQKHPPLSFKTTDHGTEQKVTGHLEKLQAFLGAVLEPEQVQHVVAADIQSLYELWSLFRCTFHGNVDDFLQELGWCRCAALEGFVAAVRNMAAPPKTVSRLCDPPDEEYDVNWPWELTPLSKLRQLELLEPSQIREGIVVRSNDDPDRSFKVISNQVLLGDQAKTRKKKCKKSKKQGGKFLVSTAPPPPTDLNSTNAKASRLRKIVMEKRCSI